MFRIALRQVAAGAHGDKEEPSPEEDRGKGE
jgi:hypothetical protein